MVLHDPAVLVVKVNFVKEFFRAGTFNLCGLNPAQEVFCLAQDTGILQKSIGIFRIYPLSASLIAPGICYWIITTLNSTAKYEVSAYIPCHPNRTDWQGSESTITYKKFSKRSRTQIEVRPRTNRTQRQSALRWRAPRRSTQIRVKVHDVTTDFQTWGMLHLWPAVDMASSVAPRVPYLQNVVQSVYWQLVFRTFYYIKNKLT